MAQQARTPNFKSKPIRVLHVDDEPADLEITRIFLKRRAKTNFVIVSVLSAEEALDKLKSEHFDVVISDYRMPGMDGLEFLEAVRNDENLTHIPFIIFTGKGGADVATVALNKGADRYIAKNGNPTQQCDELVHTIRDLLRGRMGVDAQWRGDSRPLEVAVKESKR